jgi:hypothetical protein
MNKTRFYEINSAPVPALKPQGRLGSCEFFSISCCPSPVMVQRVSDREQRSTMAHSKRTRSSSPSNGGPSKRSRSTRTKISSDAKAPTGFFQRILKSFTSQSQDPQPTTEDESSYSSNNETANTRNKTPKSTSKQRELDSLESQHNSHARAVTPYSDQSSESEAKPKTSHTKCKCSLCIIEDVLKKISTLL